MISKRSKVYVPYLYARINYKSKGGGAYIIIWKGTVHFKKQTKTK